MTKQIKTWLERCRGDGDALATDAMQAEIDELCAALAQAEQPPKYYTVIGLDKNGVSHLECVTDVHQGAKDEIVITYAKAIAQAQPAKWEPLSEARICELNDAACDKYMTQDARAIELARAIEAEITKGQQ